jgi:ABC-type iron transport system FetAB permease component
MKWLAILMSPFAGSFLLVTAFYMTADKDGSDDYLLGFTLVFIGSFLIQILVVEPVIYILKLYLELTLKVYYWFAVSVCLSFTFIVFCANQKFEKEVLLFLYIYALGNVLVYNELYFKKLED